MNHLIIYINIVIILLQGYLIIYRCTVSETFIHVYVVILYETVMIN